MDEEGDEEREGEREHKRVKEITIKYMVCLYHLLLCMCKEREERRGKENERHEWDDHG